MKRLPPHNVADSSREWRNLDLAEHGREMVEDRNRALYGPSVGDERDFVTFVYGWK